MRRRKEVWKSKLILRTSCTYLNEKCSAFFMYTCFPSNEAISPFGLDASLVVICSGLFTAGDICPGPVRAPCGVQALTGG